MSNRRAQMRWLYQGNVHLQTSTKTKIDKSALALIEAAVNCPLVCMVQAASGMKIGIGWLRRQRSVTNVYRITPNLRLRYGC